MKNWWISILAILVFASSFQSSLVLVDYQINRDFYETHCENKNKPELNCHGKCQLNEETEKKSGIYLVAKFCFEMNVLPTSKVQFSTHFLAEETKKDKNFIDYSSPIFDGFVAIIPHPPEI